MTRQSGTYTWIWFLFGLCGTAFGQTIPNGNVPLSSGQVWTLPQWNTAWQAKVDVTNGTATGLTLSGPTLSGTVAGTPTFSGAVTLNGAGTGLSVANNAQIGTAASNTTTLGANTSTSTRLFLNRAAANSAHIDFQTAGSGRWQEAVSSDAESGSNAGSYLNLTAFSDAGATLGILMQGRRDLYQMRFGNVTLPLSGASTFNPTFVNNLNLAGGPIAGQVMGAQFVVNSDTLNISSNSVRYVEVDGNFGGAGFVGGRIGFLSNITQTGAIASSSLIEGAQASLTLTNTFGGTGLTLGTAAGAGSALNPYFVMSGAFTNGLGGSGEEIDVSGRTGTSFTQKTGLLIALDSQDAVQGTLQDAALQFANQAAQGAGRGWKALISVGSVSGYAGMATDGVLWNFVHNAGGGDTMTVNKGLSWANATFTTSAIETPGFTLDGSGNITALSVGNGATALQVSGAGSWSANGAVSVSLTNIAPTGAHATVQEWLTFKDASGTVRYVPAF